MKRSKLMSTILVLSCCYMGTAHADWGDFLNDIKEAGKEFLAGDSEITSSLDLDTIISGLKEALDIGSRAAIDDVSKPGGYLANDLIHIPLPPELQQVGDLMRKFGMGEQADQFENSLNQAAEKAAPQATNIIVDAINNMSIEDANNILNGEDDAATQYFKTNTSEALTDLFQPSVEDSLNQMGSTKYYNDLAKQVASLPLVGENINLDLPAYVTEQALNGLFAMIALEEKKIRENPAARTTELLKKVFTD
ncbi:MAG: DUF4197 domain-containing protein [Proteobacteria bacterium]|nr:DUF4197 domain-containing protein [Pseudomonadota bacterium]